MSAPPFGRRWIVFAACVAAIILVNLPNFVYPFFEDSGIFATIGRWMHAGLLPDRDLLDMKPPAIHWVAYIAYAIGGTSPIGARVVELVFILATAIACGRITERSGSAPGVWTALVCGILSSGALWGLAERGQVEFYQAAMMAWGCCLFIEGALDKRIGMIALAGFFLGLAAWFKPQAGLLGIFLAVVLLVLRRRDGFREALRAVGALAAGALSISAVFVSWLWVTGGLRPFLDTMLVINRDYVALGTQPGLVYTLFAMQPRYLSTLATVATSGLAALGLASALRPSERATFSTLVIVLWLGAAFIQFWSGHYLFSYHKVIFVAPVACLVAQGCWTLGSSITLPTSTEFLRRGLASAVLSVYVVSLITTPKLSAETASLSSWVAGRTSAAQIQCEYGKELHYYDYCAQLTAARYVRDRTQPGDSVQVIGIGAAFYLKVERPPATRFLLASLALDSRYQGQSERFREFMSALLRRPPAYILARTNDYFPWFDLPAGLQMLQLAPELRDFVKDRYVLEGEISPGFLAYRRR